MTKTYRGETLDELLPQIQAELGADAVITRQREGVVGGLGGFFGKRCVEVEARTGEHANGATAVLPPRAAVAAYDTGDALPDEFDDSPLLRTLLAQSSPFAEELDRAEHELDRAEPSAPLLVPQSWDVAALLARAGLPERLVTDVLREAAREAGLGGTERDRVRRALRRRIAVRTTWRGRSRRIALVGPSGLGRTTVTAQLCNAYASGGLSVGVLSLESARQAMSILPLTDAELEFASRPEDVGAALTRLGRRELVVADTPAVDPDDAAGVARVAELLAALRPHETHLLLPAGASPEAGRLLVRELAEPLGVDRLLVAHAGPDGAAAVGVSLATDLPLSYLATSPDPRLGLELADPDALAARLVP